uniref:Nuclear RNAi defective-2 protein (inferred by orthology to a C. elegans protein) n=1 Tax=Strongyloides venezuelensis TaxID=75913 RepID=A0A0K0EWF9_STRVS
MSLFPGYGDSEGDTNSDHEIEKSTQKGFIEAISSNLVDDKNLKVKDGSSSESPPHSDSSERYRRRKKKEERRLKKKLKKEKRRKDRKKHSSYSGDEDNDKRMERHKKKDKPLVNEECTVKSIHHSNPDNSKGHRVNLHDNKCISGFDDSGHHVNNVNIQLNNTPSRVAKKQVKESLLREKEAQEMVLRSERNSLKSLIDSDPKDLELWLKFLKLQDKESKIKGDPLNVTCEIKLSIIEKAMKNIGSKCVELKIEKLKCLCDLGDYNKTIKQWEIYLIQHPNSLSLWEAIMDMTLFNFSRFSVRVCIRVMVDCYRTLAKLLRGEIVTHKPEPGTEMFLADLLVRIIKLHFHFGYSEIAVFMVSSFVEFNFSRPKVLEGQSFKELLKHFAMFCKCKCSKAGFKGAIGWKNCYNEHSDCRKSDKEFGCKDPKDGRQVNDPMLTSSNVLNTSSGNERRVSDTNQHDLCETNSQIRGSIDKDQEITSSENFQDTPYDNEYIKEEDDYFLLAQKANHPMSNVWVTVEQIREKYYYFQCTDDFYSNGDKDNIVNFEKDVSYTIFDFSHEVKEYLLREIVKVFRVNIDKTTGALCDPDIHALYDVIDTMNIDTHPTYESLCFIERVFKFLERENDVENEYEKLDFGIYKTIVRYGKNLALDGRKSAKFAKKLKENFIDTTLDDGTKEKHNKLITFIDDLLYDSQFMDQRYLDLDKIDISTLFKIYEPISSQREELLLQKAMYNYCRRSFTKKKLVNEISFFLMNNSLDSIYAESNDYSQLINLGGRKIYSLHDGLRINHKFFCDWRLDDLMYTSGLTMILQYQKFCNPSASFTILEYIQSMHSHERMEKCEELFLLQEEIYSNYYEKKNEEYGPSYDNFVVTSVKKYPKFVNLLMVYLSRCGKHRTTQIDSSFIESLDVSKLPKMMAIIYNEYLLFKKELSKGTSSYPPYPGFDRFRQAILKYADEITKMTLSPIIWNLLLKLESKYGSRESLKRSFFRGLESVGWSKEYYMKYLLCESSAFDDVFQLLIEKGFRVRCLKEELPILLQH